MRLFHGVIFSIILLYVVSAKDGLVNAVFSIWVGAWVMTKIFKYLFNFKNDAANLPWYRFSPRRFMWIDLMIADGITRKQTLFVLLWWTSGVLATFLTFQFLELVLISS